VSVPEPSPVTWQDIGVQSSGLIDALHAELKIKTPNALQRSSMSPILEGHDTVLSSYTGSGKTLAALVPLVQRLLLSPDVRERHFDAGCQPFLLVVAPTTGLAHQISDVAVGLLSRQYALRALSKKEHREYGRQLEGTVPNRIAQMLTDLRPNVVIDTARQVRNLISNGALGFNLLRCVMFDEVDRLFDQDTSYFNQVLEQLPREGVQKVLTSASALAHPNIGYLLDHMRPEFQFIDSSFTCRRRHRSSVGGGGFEGMAVPPSVRHAVMEIRNDDGSWASKRNEPLLAFDAKVKTLLDLLSIRGSQETVLVFASKANGVCRALLNKLFKRGVPVWRLTRDGYSRSDAEDRDWSGGDKLPVYVATDEFGARGLDKESVTMVVNFDHPMGHKNYLHRAGRTGRAGREGLVVNLVSNQKEQRFIGNILAKIGSPPLYTAELQGEKRSERGLQLDVRLASES